MVFLQENSASDFLIEQLRIERGLKFSARFVSLHEVLIVISLGDKMVKWKHPVFNAISIM